MRARETSSTTANQSSGRTMARAPSGGMRTIRMACGGAERRDRAGAAAPSRLPGQEISRPPHRLHIPRMPRVRLDLLPEAADVHVDGSVEGLVGLLALDQLEQLIAGQHAPGVARQRGEEVVLVRG